MLQQEKQISNLHSKTKAHIAVGQQLDDRFYENFLKPDQIPDYYGKEDVLVSINRFRKTRGICGLRELNCFFMDIDQIKHANYSRYSGWEFAMFLLERLYGAKIKTSSGKTVPIPSLAIHSGSGVHLYWILEKQVPPTALPRWDRVRIQLNNAFAPYGKDPKYTGSLSQCGRIVGTINSKYGAVVYNLHDSGIKYNFHEFSDKILPYTKAEVAEYKRLNLKDGNGKDTKKKGGFSCQELWLKRFYDLQKIKDMQYGDGPLPPNQRNNWLFISCVCLGWLFTDEQKQTGEYEKAVYELCTQATGYSWTEKHIRQQMQHLIRRVQGEDILGRGNYKMSNSWIIETLQLENSITEKLDIIKPKNDRRYKQTRPEYIRACHNKTQTVKERAKKMAVKGYTIAEISQKLNINRSYVYKILKD